MRRVLQCECGNTFFHVEFTGLRNPPSGQLEYTCALCQAMTVVRLGLTGNPISRDGPAEWEVSQ